MLLLFWACAPCPECEVCETCAPAPATEPPSDREEALLAPVRAELRAGVRPFGPDSIGVCAGKGDCENFLGPSPGELPPGDYHLRAELRVPNVGPAGTWKVELHMECTRTVTKPDGTQTSHTNNRTFARDVQYAGESRGFQLSPLWPIQSPPPVGAEDCRYRLTLPSSGRPTVVSGSWLAPSAP